jgi:hypothetical protein
MNYQNGPKKKLKLEHSSKESMWEKLSRYSIKIEFTNNLYSCSMN